MVILLSGTAISQEVIENTDKPSNSKELRLHNISRLDFMHFHGAVFYDFKTGRVDAGGGLEVVDIPNILLAVSQDGTSITELLSFPIQTLRAGGAWVSATGLVAIPYKNRFLDVKGRPMGTHGDSVFVREQDEDGLISIVKFRVADE